jgi:hypothetical protein
MDKVEEVLKQIFSICQNEQMSISQIICLISSLSLSLGSYLYDKDPDNLPAIAEDYKNSPTVGAALILHSKGLIDIMTIFLEKGEKDE